MLGISFSAAKSHSLKNLLPHPVSLIGIPTVGVWALKPSGQASTRGTQVTRRYRYSAAFLEKVGRRCSSWLLSDCYAIHEARASLAHV